jgi:hypothetical protein
MTWPASQAERSARPSAWSPPIGHVEALAGFIEAVYTDRPGQPGRAAARAAEAASVGAPARM